MIVKPRRNEEALAHIGLSSHKKIGFITITDVLHFTQMLCTFVSFFRSEVSKLRLTDWKTAVKTFSAICRDIGIVIIFFFIFALSLHVFGILSSHRNLFYQFPSSELPSSILHLICSPLKENDVTEEVYDRVAAAERCYYSLQKHFQLILYLQRRFYYVRH